MNNSGNLIYNLGNGTVVTDSSNHNYFHMAQKVDASEQEKERVRQCDVASESSQLTPRVAQQGDVDNHGRYEFAVRDVSY